MDCCRDFDSKYKSILQKKSLKFVFFCLRQAKVILSYARLARLKTYSIM